MALFDSQIMAIFSWDLFRQITAGEAVTMYKINLFTTMLASHGVPFDMSYVSGSRKDAPAVQLTIHVNPVTTLVFAIGLASGANVFAPSP